MTIRVAYPSREGPLEAALDLIPEEHGTYVLVLRLDRAKNLKIGRLGTFTLPAGCYLYVGSAFLSGGLHVRVRHHLAPVKRIHWHIDYLRKIAAPVEIWFAEGQNREHEWAMIIAQMPACSVPVPRFGSSGCSCPAHLFFSGAKPSPHDFAHNNPIRAISLQNERQGGIFRSHSIPVTRP